MNNPYDYYTSTSSKTGLESVRHAALDLRFPLSRYGRSPTAAILRKRNLRAEP